MLHVKELNQVISFSFYLYGLIKVRALKHVKWNQLHYPSDKVGKKIFNYCFHFIKSIPWIQWWKIHYTVTFTRELTSPLRYTRMAAIKCVMARVWIFSINTYSVDWLPWRFLHNYNVHVWTLCLHGFHHLFWNTQFHHLHLVTPKVLHQKCPIRSNTKYTLQQKGIGVLKCSNFGVISFFYSAQIK